MATVLFCPYTGRPRHPSDIESDPEGLLIVAPDEPLFSAPFNNEPEPKPAMILRLLSEAQAGVKSPVPLADALEFRRDQYGLTRGDFAALIGLSLAHYGEVISGARSIPKRAMRRAYAIGVPADVLLSHESA